jgi:hypothetical protein
VAPLEPGNAPRRAAAALSCERVGFAGGRGTCLVAQRELFTTYRIVFFDSALNPTGTAKLHGSPSRTRVSAAGRLGAVTVFALGGPHNYTDAGFATRTSIHALATGAELGELEQFTTCRAGNRIKAADFNFWGVTFTPDARGFYATLSTAGNHFLVRGDIAGRTATVIHENVECPSLSPDARHVAYKKRFNGEGRIGWQLYVLELATGREIALSEKRSIDDQLEWLDARQVPVDSDASVKKNAETIRKAIEEATRDGSQVVLVGHSKGGVDAAAALAMHPELKDKVRAMVAIQSPFGGSPIAQDIQSTPIIRPLVNGVVSDLFRGDPASVKDLTYDARRRWARGRCAWRRRTSRRPCRSWRPRSAGRGASRAPA